MSSASLCDLIFTNILGFLSERVVTPPEICLTSILFQIIAAI